MNKRSEDWYAAVVAHDEAAEVSNPRDGAFNLSSLFNSAKWGATFSRCASVRYSDRLMADPLMSLYRQITYETL